MSPTLQMELWLVKRLGEHGVSVFEGDTTPELRQERINAAIRAAGLGSVVVGRREGKPETYEQLFRRVYDCPLKAAL